LESQHVAWLFTTPSRKVVDTVLHVYTCIFSAMIVVTEREWGWFFDMFVSAAQRFHSEKHKLAFFHRVS
jgi:hypothetical protein